MIEAVLFDCDGVLVSTVGLHAEAFRRALIWGAPDFPPHYLLRENLNGLSTREKLSRLSLLGLEKGKHERIWREKQRLTSEMIPEQIPFDERRVAMVRALKELGCKVGCVSNSIRATTNQMLACAGFSGVFDLVLSNEDAPHQKPAPDPYLLAMVRLGVAAERTLVVEDAPHGVESARASGANVMVVDSFQDVSLDQILKAIHLLKEAGTSA